MPQWDANLELLFHPHFAARLTGRMVMRSCERWTAENLEADRHQTANPLEPRLQTSSDVEASEVTHGQILINISSRLPSFCHSQFEPLPMPEDVTQILNRIEDGDSQAANQLLPLVYEELRKLAANRMAREASDRTLQPTALVHEAFMRLVGSDSGQEWDNRGHFFAAAAEAMRRILIDSARKRNSVKRGGQNVRKELREDDAAIDADDSDTLLALDEALTQLAKIEPELARMVELRYFTGLTIDETAKVLGVSARTTKRNWTYARAWLKRAMDSEDSVDS